MKRYHSYGDESRVWERCEMLGEYLVSHQTTVRETASHFGISKSTVHKDVAERLPQVNVGLSGDVRRLLEKNKSERHIRGGLATRKKYELQGHAGDAPGKTGG